MNKKFNFFEVVGYVIEHFLLGLRTGVVTRFTVEIDFATLAWRTVSSFGSERLLVYTVTVNA